MPAARQGLAGQRRQADRSPDCEEDSESSEAAAVAREQEMLGLLERLQGSEQLTLADLRSILGGMAGTLVQVMGENRGLRGLAQALQAKVHRLEAGQGVTDAKLSILVDAANAQQPMTLFVHAPATTSWGTILDAVALAAGTQRGMIQCYERVGRKRVQVAVPGRPAREVQTWRVRICTELGVRALDGGHHLAGVADFSGIFISEDLTQAERARKKAVVSSDSYKAQRESCRRDGKLVRWRRGLPYWLSRGQDPAHLLRQPFEVTKQHLPEPPATGGAARQQPPSASGASAGTSAGGVSASALGEGAGAGGGLGSRRAPEAPKPSAGGAATSTPGAAAGALVIRTQS